MNLEDRKFFWKEYLVGDKDEAVKFLHEKRPKYLYKFRNGDERDVSALESGKIWFSRASRQNDENDCKVVHRGYEVKDFQKNILICCFSEVMEEKMWSDYANGYRGFCLKYRVEDLNKMTLPVLYVKKNEMHFNKPCIKSEKMLTVYEKDENKWSEENEWRRILINDAEGSRLFQKNFVTISDEDPGILWDICNPVEIIMGKDIASDIEKRLIDFSNMNNIYCYKERGC